MRVVRMRSLAKSRNILPLRLACNTEKHVYPVHVMVSYVKQVFMQWNLNEISHCCFGY